ncbi:threonine aspartase 1-like [Venturia canescens]|uniref:threonine aspartase 1-like n=1 Tax=Venturia canescens TaxID=32260 RepID=UPI001C9D51BC|nr:threonine aspartase 1-like [Venturia canescens]
MTEVNQGFIVVHVGAGQHADSLKPMYRKLCREACKEGLGHLEKIGGTSVDAVVEATAVLENSPLTNAGFGSNLTLNGDVECDASVMDGSNCLFGALGAVSGIKNPIVLAKYLCQQQLRKRTHGRIPPSFLVGSGAHVWANEMGIQTVPVDELISDKARKVYAHYKRKLDVQHKGIHELVKKRMDTVGAVCVDRYGNVAAACSSGGIILKYPGRVGQAGVWGCGAWARNGNCSVASSTSGCGEHLIRTTLARTLAEAVVNSSCPTTTIHQTMKKKFIESDFLGGVKQKLGGAIIVRYSPHERFGDVLWTHTTNSMIVGYMNTKNKVAKSQTSTLGALEVGRIATVGGVGFKL